MKARIEANRPLTDLEFFARELTDWLNSSKRKEMLDGNRYYDGDHDILQRKRMVIGEKGDQVEAKHLPNNKLVDNQYAKYVDQKKNYLLGKPITFDCANENYAKELKEVFGKKFMRTIKNAGCDAINSGISWLYPHYDRDGKLVFRMYNGFDILPFWTDVAHTELDCACRVYFVEMYTGKELKIVQKVDIFKPDALYTYIFENGVLTPDTDTPKSYYITVKDKKGEHGYAWNKLPLIPIKFNAREIPLIRRVKSLQDAINMLLSDFENNMQQDVHTTVLVLQNYDGTDLGEFRRNLAVYGVIKVRSTEGIPGGVDTLTIEVNAENYKTVLALLKKALIENARGYDAKDDRMGGNPNQMNIRSMYSDIDLDANDQETELQASFEDMLWFVNQYLANTGGGSYDKEEITVIFDRDILINESEAIDNCAKSVGIISNKTIVSMHPFTADPAAEMKQIEEERTATDDPYRAAYERMHAAPVTTHEEQ